MFKRRGGPNGAQERAADTHAEEEASATAYDTDHDGKLDLVETMLRNYDTDHNGRFSNADVKGIVTDVLQARRSAKRYGRWAAALVVAMLVLIGSMFGAAYVADISTREVCAPPDRRRLAESRCSRAPTRRGRWRRHAPARGDWQPAHSSRTRASILPPTPTPNPSPPLGRAAIPPRENTRAA